MFQSPAKRFQALMAVVDDMLVGLEPLPEEPPIDDAVASPRRSLPHPHPHRRPVRIERTRRPGAVPPRPAHCLCPVRAGDAAAAKPIIR